MMEALEGASSLQLYQLKAIIEGMLADPRRSLASRTDLHLGQAVRFVDFRDGQMRSGKVIAFKDTQATVLEQGTRRTWKIPCVAMEACSAAERHDGQTPYVPPPEPAAATTPAWSCASTSAPPPSARPTAAAGACRSTCCAKCSTSDVRQCQAVAVAV